MASKRWYNNAKHVFAGLLSDAVRGCGFPWKRIFLTMDRIKKKIKINYIDVYIFLFLSSFLPSANNDLCGTREIWKIFQLELIYFLFFYILPLLTILNKKQVFRKKTLHVPSVEVNNMSLFPDYNKLNIHLLFGYFLVVWFSYIMQLEE